MIDAEIIPDPSGDFFGLTPEFTLAVLPHREESEGKVPEGETKIFHRNGIKWHTDGSPSEKVRWLVGELNGVRAYVGYDEEGKLNILLSDRDLRP